MLLFKFYLLRNILYILLYYTIYVYSNYTYMKFNLTSIYLPFRFELPMKKKPFFLLIRGPYDAVSMEKNSYFIDFHIDISMLKLMSIK